MANHFSDLHLCPVCWQSWVRGKSIFCSDECRRVANNFNDRTRYYRDVLSELGFKVTRHDGIFLDFEIPDAIKVYYPVYCHTFSFPVPGLSIDAMDGNSLLVTVSEFIGDHAVSIIKRWGPEDYNRDMNFAFQFAYEVSENFILGHNKTECPKCGLEHVDTRQGWDPEFKVCTDCSIAAIPF